MNASTVPKEQSLDRCRAGMSLIHFMGDLWPNCAASCANHLYEQTLLGLLKIVSDFGNTVFVDIITKICDISKVRDMQKHMALFC